MKPPYIVGIAGGTGSGKTTLAQNLCNKLGTDAHIIAHDAYYRDHSHLPVQQRAQTNFDHPNTLETDLLISHLQHLIQGHSIEIPIYDFTTHSRKPETTPFPPTPIIIVEGILLFENANLRSLFNLKIYVDTDADIRLSRRLKRDTQERGRTTASVLHQYTTTVRPMHNTYVEPTRKHADLIIPGENNTTLATQLILSHLQTKRSRT